MASSTIPTTAINNMNGSNPITTTTEPKILREYRIAVSGPPAVGKSALTVRFTQLLFVDEYDPTIEDSYKHYATIENRHVLLDILDTAGQEDYASMKESYMRRGEGFLLVFSVTSLLSFESIQLFYDQIIRVKEDSEFVPIILIGNKSDLKDEREVSELKLLKLSKDLKIPYIETSAKLDLNVNDLFYSVVKMINKAGPVQLDHLTGKEIGGGSSGDGKGNLNGSNGAGNNGGASSNQKGNSTNNGSANNGSSNQNTASNTQLGNNRQSQSNKLTSSDSKNGGGCCTIM